MPTGQEDGDPVRVACQAMGTRFEIVLHGHRESYLRAAGEEALHEIQRLESQLNLYSENSEITGINARAAQGPIRVEPGLFQLLQSACRLSEETSGAFDITVAPLMKCWGFMKDTGRIPHPNDLQAAHALVGTKHLILNESERTVAFTKPDVMIDLGAIGKGYAVEAAAEILREDGITSALLHGGTSTVFAIGKPPGDTAWKVAIEFPDDASLSPPVPEVEAIPQRILAIVPLCDEALSVSAVWGKAFQAENKQFGHVIDPRTGQPANRAMLAAAVLPSATETDAFSTALLIGGRDAQPALTQTRPNMRTLVAGRDSVESHVWTSTMGIDPLPQSGTI